LDLALIRNVCEAVRARANVKMGSLARSRVTKLVIFVKVLPKGEGSHRVARIHHEINVVALIGHQISL
jgi:hypothetical protein